MEEVLQSLIIITTRTLSTVLMEFWTLTLFFDRKFVKISNKTLTLVYIRMNIRKWWMEAGIYVTEYGKDNSFKHRRYFPFEEQTDSYRIFNLNINICTDNKSAISVY